MNCMECNISLDESTGIREIMYGFICDDCYFKIMSEHYDKNPILPEPEKECSVCKKPFKASEQALCQDYCDECYDKIHLSDEVKKCLYCGEEFETVGDPNKHNFCSLKCLHSFEDEFEEEPKYVKKVEKIKNKFQLLNIKGV